jgi:MFS family permease
MSEEQTENGTKTQSNKTGGLSFAVTLLGVLGSISYAVYKYFQNNPVSPYWYWLVCGLIPVALILVLCLLFYILIKGFSMEVQDSEHRKYLEKGASLIYQGTFLIFTMLLVLIVFVFFFTYLKIGIVGVVSVFTVSISILVGALLVLPRLKKNPQRICIILVYMLFVGGLLWLPLHSAVLLYYPLQGRVTADMESIYYKNDVPIPVLIQVTGPNPDLSIKLQNSTKVYNLTLKPEHNLSKTEFTARTMFLSIPLS